MKKLTLLLALLFPLCGFAQNYQSSNALQFWQNNAKGTVPTILTVAPGTGLACVAIAGMQHGTGNPVIHDSKPDVWVASPLNQGLQAAFYAFPCSPGEHDITVSQDGIAPDYRNVDVVAYSGVTGFDHFVPAHGTSQNAVTQAIASSGELLVAGITEVGPHAPNETPTPGASIRQENYYGQLVLMDSVATGNDAPGLTFSGTVAPDWTEIVAVFKTAPLVAPVLTTFKFVGALRNCVICDGTDNVSPPVNVFTGTQVQFLQDNASVFVVSLDASGNLIAAAGINLAVPAPLNFSVNILTPSGTPLTSAPLKISVDPLLLVNERTIRLTLQMDATTGLPRGAAVSTGP